MSTPDVDIAQLSQQMTALLESFENHPLMQPPETNPTLFFLFDFIRNTRRQLEQINATALQAGDATMAASLSEVRGRNRFAKTLIEDTSGKLALLTGGNPGRPIDFGDEIRERAAFLG